MRARVAFGILFGLLVLGLLAPGPGPQTAVAAQKVKGKGKAKGKDKDKDKHPTVPDDEIDPTGRWKEFDEGPGIRYAVWYDEGQWHVRAKGKKGERDVFNGIITVQDGTIVGGEFRGMDKAPKAKDADWLVIAPDTRSLEYRFVTFGKLDGFSFKLSKKATSVTFKLLFAGDDDADRVFIGARGVHPEKEKFTLKADPSGGE